MSDTTASLSPGIDRLPHPFVREAGRQQDDGQTRASGLCRPIDVEVEFTPAASADIDDHL